MTRRKEKVIVTEGSNIREAMNIPGIGLRRIWSNDIVEVQSKFGVESASLVAVYDMKSIFDGYGTSVDLRHIKLMIQSMSKTGMLVAMSRSGFNQNKDLGWLKRGSFEEIIKIIMTSALRGEVDHLEGNVNNMILGNHIPMGTRYGMEINSDESMHDQTPIQKFDEPMNKIDPVTLARVLPFLEKEDMFVKEAFAIMHKDKDVAYMRSIVRKNCSVHVPNYDFLTTDSKIPRKRNVRSFKVMKPVFSKANFSYVSQPYDAQAPGKIDPRDLDMNMDNDSLFV